MPRGSSGGGRSGGRSGFRPPPPAARRPPPKTVNSAPPPATAQPSGGFSFFESIADGLAWGAGTSIARSVVDAVMGPRTILLETVVSDDVSASPIANSMSYGSCDIPSKAFQDCLNDFGSDISKCQFYMDMLTECRKKSDSIMAA